MTDTKITGPLSAAEAFLRELCERHGFSAVQITVEANGSCDAFIRDGKGFCDLGFGDTLAAALNAANKGRVQRLLTAPQLVDEENA